MPVAIRTATQFVDLDDCLHAKIVYETGVAGTAVTLVEDGDNDVTTILGYHLAVKTSGGDSDVGFGFVKNDDSEPLWDDGGTNTLTLAVAADGSVTLQRTAGALTYNVSGIIFWI
jgi:hypothetical protein